MGKKLTYIEMNGRVEKLTAGLKGLFRAHGYLRYRMEKFESYDVYLRHRDYVSADSIVTLTDTGGRLTALKPDVTLSVLNNLPPQSTERKYYYDERVFRRDKAGEYRELRQVGTEYIGGSGAYPICEATLLALKGLMLLGGESVLSIGNLDAVNELLAMQGLTREDEARALSFIENKAFHELRELVSGESAERLLELVSIEGEPVEAAKKLRRATAGTRAESAADETEVLLGVIEGAGLTERVRLDMSLTGDVRYYSGIVMRGYMRGAAGAVLKGGSYDNMLRRMGRSERAIGFAFDLGAIAQTIAEDDAADVAVEYLDEPPGVVAAAVEKFVSEGLRTRAVKLGSKIEAKRVVRAKDVL